MKRYLFEVGKLIEQSYAHNPSKKWTLRRDVILGDIILKCPVELWKIKT